MTQDAGGGRPLGRMEQRMTESELLVRCRWLLRTRWVFATALAGVLALNEWLRLQEMTGPIWVVAALIGLYNFGLTAWTRRLDSALRLQDAEGGTASGRGRIETLVFVQMALDALALTLVLRYSGGIENPLAFFYIFHVTLASILLSRRLSYGLASVATGLVTVIAAGEWSGLLRPHYRFLSGLSNLTAPVEIHSNGPLVICYLAAFACAMYVTTYVATSVAAQLRQREAQLLRTTEALRETSCKLAELEERKSQFMVTAAHQLKSPLAAIVSLINAAATGQISPAKQKEMLGRAVSRAEVAVRQVQELLALARLRTLSPARQSWKVFDFREVLDGVRAAASDREEEKRVKVDFEAPAQPAWVEGSRDDLYDAVMNLVDNALKYTEPRPASEAGTVRVALRPAPCPEPGRSSEGWELTVSDTGIGIPQAELPKLFQDFFRAGNAVRRKIPGTGLGLSIVEQVVRMHGGAIRADSVENRGSTFTVWLPRAP
jgi:signal transduction histidine kinase